MRGTVITFDEARGLGSLDADGVIYPFHCTAMVDGSRTVAIGRSVTFGVRPAGRGQWEATAIENLC